MTRITRWWWVRHAPVVDPPGVIHGHSEVAADTSDALALAALAASLPEDAHWVTSGLTRTDQTAAALLRGFERKIAVDPGFAEQDFGEWQGRRWDDLAGDNVTAFWLDWWNRAPPGGESFAGMAERVESAVLRWTEFREGGDIVAVVHAGTIRGALKLALDLTPSAALSIAIDPLSLTRIDAVTDERGLMWRTIAVNRTFS